MRVLAIGCHPDDLEIACSGTLRKYVEQGADVYMCHVAKGDQGHVIIPPEELGGIREKEAENAGKLIGAKEVFNLNVSDMQVNRHDQAQIDAVADVVRYCRPDVVITHNTEDYMQDHVETSYLATNGCFAAGLPQAASAPEPHAMTRQRKAAPASLPNGQSGCPLDRSRRRLPTRQLAVLPTGQQTGQRTVGRATAAQPLP